MCAPLDEYLGVHVGGRRAKDLPGGHSTQSSRAAPLGEAKRDQRANPRNKKRNTARNNRTKKAPHPPPHKVIPRSQRTWNRACELKSFFSRRSSAEFRRFDDTHSPALANPASFDSTFVILFSERGCSRKPMNSAGQRRGVGAYLQNARFQKNHPSTEARRSRDARSLRKYAGAQRTQMKKV